MTRLHILGVMTGTSCDGLDAACVEFSPDSWEPSWSFQVEFPKKLRQRVHAIQQPDTQMTLKELLVLDRDLSLWYAEAIRLVCQRRPVDVIANHGQTIAHHPSEGVTLQLGNPAWVVKKTGLTCVSHFREGDIAGGGQGAPMVPRFHRLLAHSFFGEATGVAIHNLGGISNFTYFGKGGSIVAADTGPGNAWIDAATSLATKGKHSFDAGGALAMKGEPDSNAILRVLKDPYFRKALPKTTGRDDFPFEKLMAATKSRGADLVATAAWITIESIARCYAENILEKKLPLHTVLLCGGGTKNVALLEGLRARLPGIEVHSIEEAGWDPQLVEAQAFGYLGMLSLMGDSLGGKWTGADDHAPAGWITPGRNWPHVSRMISRFLEKRSASAVRKKKAKAAARRK